MSTRKVILGLAVCLSLGVFAQQLFSQGTRSSGSSGRSGSVQSRGTRPQRMPGQPDFERMRDMSHEEKMKYFQQLAEQQRKAAEEQEAVAMQQTLGADDKQWKVIEPRLKKVKHYREQAFIGTGPPFQSNFSSFSTGPGGAQGFSGGFGGGFQFQAGGSGAGGNFQSVPGRQSFDGPISDGEILCEEIQMLLNDPQATPEQVSQKLDALRIARDKARRQWIAVQQQLREVLDFRQQARLVLMGLLD
ncbi:MAG TPA: hypothetical protein VMX36_03920 [Sedimentisphaerales bacterium]|nr:hypothetical protein [Sedimentisphaerales bacterium]